MSDFSIKYYLLDVLIIITFWGCKSQRSHNLKLFTLLDSTKTHVDFINRVQDRADFNIIDYPYFYDGGGVAVGDINNDGLPDIYFTSNLHGNHLYINEGHFQFKDITQKAGVGGGDSGWTTGVTMADVNGDSLLDLYVCRVQYHHKKGKNQLFINNGDSTFTEKAAAYGLDQKGFGTQAAFFDYDRDGDLDVYLLNHSIHSKTRLIRTLEQRKKHDPRAGDKLMRNDDGHFADITKKAGIFSGSTGYGLGIAINDINQDGWPDIYVSNDFQEDDFLYVNNKDGTFSEHLQDMAGHSSQASMGSDIADFNNDGRPDILTLDMRPQNEATYQRSGGPDSYRLEQIKKNLGYHQQMARNALQLNRGQFNNKYPFFSDIGALAGIDATDWSWSGLFADLNLDGHKDLFITNGIYRRPNNLDYLLYVTQDKIQQELKKKSGKKELSIIKRLPSKKVDNYAFENMGNLSFKSKAKAWGLAQPSFSNGAAYADLDNDGDLDLITNNVNMPAFIYRNNADTLTNNSFLKVKLQGNGKNTQGVGARVILKNKGESWYRLQMPVRGFESSVSSVLNFGLGSIKKIGSVEVIWPDGSKQMLQHIGTDQQLTLKQSEAKRKYTYDNRAKIIPVFYDITQRFHIHYKHHEDTYNNFRHQPLMPHMLSTEGPALAVGDINGDGLDDFFAGGARNQAGQLYLQTRNRHFKRIDEKVFRQDSASEDVDATFFDADGDGNLDLYVVSGGNEFAAGDSRYQDRLYINNGRGYFKKSSGKLPRFFGNGSSVAAGDFDQDGDMDLFVGSRSVPRNYGITPRSFLLENMGNGRFKDITEKKVPILSKIGMVTDALWTDIDGDHKPELVVVGEYMPITIFRNSGKKWENITNASGLAHTHGWWNTVLAKDFDGDGDIDLVAGNLGENSVLKTSPQKPLKLYINDFDGNGTSDPILTKVQNGKRYPVGRLNQLMKKMPTLKNNFSSYTDFSTRTVNKIFSRKKLKNADIKEVDTFESSYFINEGNGHFSVHPLPVQAQFSLIYGIIAGDFNKDGKKDLLTAGNLYGVKPSEGRYDAGYGSLIKGNEGGSFKTVPLTKSGFVIHGQARVIKKLKTNGKQNLILVARNNQKLQLFRIAPNR